MSFGSNFELFFENTIYQVCFVSATLNSPVGEFITIQLSHHIWRAKMHTQLETNTTVGACAIRCRLLTFPKDCNIYVYDGTTCYFGNNDHFANVDTTHDINDVQVHGEAFKKMLPFRVVY